MKAMCVTIWNNSIFNLDQYCYHVMKATLIVALLYLWYFKSCDRISVITSGFCWLSKVGRHTPNRFLVIWKSKLDYVFKIVTTIIFKSRQRGIGSKVVGTSSGWEKAPKCPHRLEFRLDKRPKFWMGRISLWLLLKTTSSSSSSRQRNHVYAS